MIPRFQDRVKADGCHYQRLKIVVEEQVLLCEYYCGSNGDIWGGNDDFDIWYLEFEMPGAQQRSLVSSQK